ncbi:MAG TPA: radical SAM protein [Pirellulales bacterium]|nr:radical SAM protein [Pirellulales bacterium]
MSESSPAPLVRLGHLDHLWFQVTGTRCNLTCHHCFISCSPTNDRFGYLTLEQVKQTLEQSVALGVKEYYFTGGEPFLHPEMTAMLVETLRFGPATVLTNGTVLKDAWLMSLAEAEQESLYSLEFRVSIDGFSPETNDPIRGAGTFERAMRGVEQLVEHGFLPIITAARTWSETDDHEIIGRFVEALKARGYRRPRLKILPALRLGAEARRTHGYGDDERVDEVMMRGFDVSQLVCEHSRMVTDRGVYVCPILIDSPEARLGERLADSLGPYPLRHGACYTCYQYGAICSNPSSGEASDF